MKETVNAYQLCIFYLLSTPSVVVDADLEQPDTKAKSLNEGICECNHAGQICTVELLSKRPFTVYADLEVPTTKNPLATAGAPNTNMNG